MRYFSFALIIFALIIFALSFLFGHFKNDLFGSKEMAPHLSRPTAKKTQMIAPSNTASPPSSFAARSTAPLSSPSKTPPPDILLKASGGALFHFLYETDFRQQPLSSERYQMVRERFQKAYPAMSAGKHLSSVDRETVARTGMLKALGEVSRRFPNAATAATLKAFYQSIVNQPHEMFMVKRQALRNLASVSGSQTESEHAQWLGKTDPHLLSTTALGDRELIEVILAP